MAEGDICEDPPLKRPEPDAPDSPSPAHKVAKSSHDSFPTLERKSIFGHIVNSEQESAEQELVTSGSVPLTTDKKHYFASYGDLGIHELMLRDEQRCEAYIFAIHKLASWMEGKTVMDVGSGTGLLAMACVKYGKAKRVIAVEANDQMALLSRKIIEKNGLSDRITVMSCSVETLMEWDVLGEIEVPQLDAIVSEWMGFYLFHEGMFDSVAIARDRWLKPDGLLLPNKAQIYAAPVHCKDLPEMVSDWKDHYGFDFSDFEEKLAEQKGTKEATKDPIIDRTVQEHEVAGEARMLVEFDLRRVTISELHRLASDKRWVFMPERDAQPVNGVAIWFQCHFSLDKATGAQAGDAVVLDTSPSAQPTHWKQTIVQVPSFVMEKADPGYEILLTFTRSRDNERHYVINLDVSKADGCPEIAEMLIKSAALVAESDRMERSNKVAAEIEELLEESATMVAEADRVRQQTERLEAESAARASAAAMEEMMPMPPMRKYSQQDAGIQADDEVTEDVEDGEAVIEDGAVSTEEVITAESEETAAEADGA